MVTQFRFQPAGERSASSVQRLAQRKAFTLPILLVAAQVELDKEKKCFGKVRVARRSGGNNPVACQRMRRIASRARGCTYEAIERAAAQAKLAAHPRRQPSWRSRIQKRNGRSTGTTSAPRLRELNRSLRSMGKRRIELKVNGVVREVSDTRGHALLLDVIRDHLA